MIEELILLSYDIVIKNDFIFYYYKNLIFIYFIISLLKKQLIFLIYI